MFLFGLGKNNQTGWDLEQSKENEEIDKKIAEGMADAMMFPAKLAIMQAQHDMETKIRKWKDDLEQRKREHEMEINRAIEISKASEAAEKTRLEAIDREERLIASMRELAVEIREQNRLKRFGPK